MTRAMSLRSVFSREGARYLPRWAIASNTQPNRTTAKRHLADWLLFVVLVATAGKVAAVTDTFNASGTWVAPAGVTTVIVEAWGGGGGGHDGSNAGDYGGGGGGGGAYASSVVTVTPGNSYAITIGAGGANGTPGNNGGATSFDGSTVVAAGGRGAGPVRL